MSKRLPIIFLLTLLLVVIFVLVPWSACDQGAKQTEVPAGPPRIMSFKVASENIAPDEVPLFTWEVTNAKAVTITQDGVEIYHIEALPDNDAGVFLMPMPSDVYASVIDEIEVKQPYSPGIFPSGFAGAATGKPSHVAPENWIEPELRDDRSSISKEAKSELLQNNVIKNRPGSAEITAISPDGQMSKQTVGFNFVASETDPLDDNENTIQLSNRITPPPCVRAGSSTPIIPAIKRWSVKKPVINDGEAPQFEFEVTNAHIISIRHGDEYISSVEIVNPPIISIRSLPLFTDEAYASSTSEYETKQSYSSGLFPPGFPSFKGSDYNEPKKVVWTFGEKSQEDSAEITVCSPSGDVVSAKVTFTIMRVEEQTQLPVIEIHFISKSKSEWAQMVNLSYRITDADDAWLTCGDEKQSVSPSSGSISVRPPASGCCTLTASNKLGEVQKTQCITVTPPIITFTASRNVVGPFDPVTFTWNVTGDNLTVKLVSDGSQRTVSPSGSEDIIIMKSACYYLTAENPAGRASEQQCVTVASPGFIPRPDIDEPPCSPVPPPLAPPPVVPITDGH